MFVLFVAKGFTERAPKTHASQILMIIGKGNGIGNCNCMLQKALFGEFS